MTFGPSPLPPREMSIRGVAADIYKYVIANRVYSSVAGMGPAIRKLKESQEQEQEDEVALRRTAKACLQASEVWHDVLDERKDEILKELADQEPEGPADLSGPQTEGFGGGGSCIR